MSKTPFIFGFVRCLADTGADLMRIEEAKILSDGSEVILASSKDIFIERYTLCKTFIFGTH